MNEASVLLVDDEPQLVRALRPALEAEGYRVTVAEHGAAALHALATDGGDIVLLDLGLPDLDGKLVIRRIREWSDVPIIVLSARDIEQEKIEALDLGADDYVNKPFAVGELLARLRAAIRGRDRRFSAQTVLENGPLRIDFAARKVWLFNDEVHLTPREFAVVQALGRHAGRLVTRKQIGTAVWSQPDIDPQFVRVLISQVRSKLEEDPSKPRLILTEPNLGYRMAMDTWGDKAGR